ncbi:hypothetical protein [Brachybacterium sp. YJGR34]|uniref:hypothetical protein n=1 Tax=Brachybacterium sp. YJGR34 TaxID=2059911 RepID=UPI000E0A3EAC|nr:hypothetical protein [Brachybacterium sp. YJGR34]
MPSEPPSTAPSASASGGSRRTSGDPSGEVADPSPRSRPIVATLLGAEALLLAAAATYCALAASRGILDARFGTGMAIFLVLFALAAAMAARSILVKGRFGLGYGVTWQFFQALVGASLLRGGMYWQGGLALLLALAAFVLLTRLVRSTPLPQGSD